MDEAGFGGIAAALSGLRKPAGLRAAEILVQQQRQQREILAQKERELCWSDMNSDRAAPSKELRQASQELAAADRTIQVGMAELAAHRKKFEPILWAAVAAAEAMHGTELRAIAARLQAISADLAVVTNYADQNGLQSPPLSKSWRHVSVAADGLASILPKVTGEV